MLVKIVRYNHFVLVDKENSVAMLAYGFFLEFLPNARGSKLRPYFATVEAGCIC